jgi:hypothetical protein
MRPGAPAIPARGVVRVSLAEDREAHHRQMHIVEGFDLSPRDGDVGVIGDEIASRYAQLAAFPPQGCESRPRDEGSRL